MNQFFYTRTENEKTFRDSFSMNKVIRTVEMEEGKVLVLLDDLHERSQEVPDIDIRTNKMKGTKRQRNTFQSEITLDVADAERFYKLTNIE
tara:strand:- start:1447 stop:1719 length:273 start_codon:yes stop_codon:yes gene_type:complete